jgi:hypothetical protein
MVVQHENINNITTEVHRISAVYNTDPVSVVKDFLKGLKENLLVGNLLPAGTGYVIPLS